jgi:tRNA pseudouridine38-40 synthase
MPKYFYKLDLCYKGTHYFGFQIQKDDKPTIQGEIERALLTINKGAEVSSLGSGRTDAGVHALGQIVKVGIDFDIPPESLKKALNGLLPDDIMIKSLESCKEDFHPVFGAFSKEYIYLFKDKPLDPFASELVAPSPYDLNFDLMREALEMLKGEHDFINYRCVGTVNKTTVRKIYTCSLELRANIEVGQLILKDVHVFRFCGNGFLRQMIRLLVGALWQVGLGRLSIQKFKESLRIEMAQKVGPVAPSQGLYLNEVHYDQRFD